MTDEITRSIEQNLRFSYHISTYCHYTPGIGYEIYYGDLPSGADRSEFTFLVPENTLSPARVKDCVDMFIAYHPELLL